VSPTNNPTGANGESGAEGILKPKGRRVDVIINTSGCACLRVEVAFLVSVLPKDRSPRVKTISVTALSHITNHIRGTLKIAEVKPILEEYPVPDIEPVIERGIDVVLGAISKSSEFSFLYMLFI